VIAPLDYLRRDRGAAESSIVTNRHRLHALLQVGLGKSDRLLGTLTAAACRELYAQRSRTVKPDTRRGGACSRVEVHRVVP
jgi:hypothetical protein